MTLISMLLYLLNQHPFWMIPAYLAFGIGMTIWRRNAGWAIATFLAWMFALFCMQFINAVFLNAVGTRGTAVLIDARQTSSMLNEQYIWKYEGVLRTGDGRDVTFGFDTMTASLYPLRNAIEIPPLGQRFEVKYVPGFARNVVILTDASEHGRDLQRREDAQAVMRARRQYDASPTNPAFIAEYRLALRTYLSQHPDADAPDHVRFQRALDALDALER